MTTSAAFSSSPRSPRGPGRLAGRVANARYRAAQSLRVGWYGLHYALLRHLTAPATPPGEVPYAPKAPAPDPAKSRAALRALFDQDYRNIRDGLYPAPRDMDPRLLAKALRASRMFFADAPKVAARRMSRTATQARDLAEARDQRGEFPTYYLQNFHYQTDGWLSADSAALYDTQVEVLFTGAADAMRRAALADLARHMRGRDQRDITVLDVACGTGRFLQQTLDAFPRLQAMGVDLSPAYVGEAQSRLARWSSAGVREGNAEALAFDDNSVDAAVCIYLFHELPPRVRPVVAKELARVVKPGGVVIMADSIQTGDDPGLDQMLEWFPVLFHEPYYAHYAGDGVDAYFQDAGLVKRNQTLAFFTKATAWEKPR